MSRSCLHDPNFPAFRLTSHWKYGPLFRLMCHWTRLVVNAQADIVNNEQLAPLLNQMREALAADNMLTVRSLQAELNKLLSPATLDSLTLAIEDYDFNAAETAVRALADQFSISLGS